MPQLDFIQLLTGFGILLVSLSVHEWAHAWTADRLGDSTARRLGRLTLNPLAHADPIGTIALPLIAFVTGAPLIGWARPVPVNLRNLAGGRRDFLFIAAAGPASNLVLALLAAVALRIVDSGPAFLAARSVPGMILTTALMLNVLLAVFNMVPVPPLDGGNVLAGLLPDRAAAVFDRLRPYGFLLIYALLLTGVLSALVTPPYHLIVGWLL